MKIYVLNEECSDVREDERFEWIVYSYENGGYDGMGEAVGLNKEDGLLYVVNMGHCSCYGPFDDGMDGGVKYKVEELLAENNDVLSFNLRKEVKEKVLKLLNFKPLVSQ